MWPIDHFLKPLFSTSCRDGRPRMGHNMVKSQVFCSKVKGGFFQEVRCVFQISKSPKKKLFRNTILDLKFKFPTNFSTLLLTANLNFKFRIVFCNILFWRFENRIALSERKPYISYELWFDICEKAMYNVKRQTTIIIRLRSN